MGLPLRMDNIHAPTIPSGPTTGSDQGPSNTSRLSFPELQAKKDEIEAELKALLGVLQSHGCTMNTPLTTPDGFPRADIDIAQVRTTRVRIIYLQNDHRALMSTIEKRLHEHFANQTPLETAETNGQHSTSTLSSRASAQVSLDPPFAKVNTVAPNSPAAVAGLEPGDEIRNFGYVNLSNHDGLKKVAECVQGNEGRNVLVKISRSSVATESGRRELQLTLVPRRDWGGRGLLGCHILPL